MVRKSLTAAAALAMLGMSVTAQAQDWPTRPVTMVIAFAPGGPLDTLARNLQPYLGEALGQQVVIENVPGGGGTVGSLRVSNAAADSHMFTLGSIGTHAIGQSMHKKPPYNAVTDFAPVMLVADAPQVVLARKDLPANNLKEFAVYAKANQDKMQHGSGGAGTSSHIGCVLMNQVLGVQITHVPYRGGGPAMQDLLAGRIDFICNYVSTALPSHNAKTAKVIAALNQQAHAVAPEVATAAGSRLQGSRHLGLERDLPAEERDTAAGGEAQCRAQQGAGQSGAEEAAGGHRPGRAGAGAAHPGVPRQVHRRRDQALGGAGEGERGAVRLSACKFKFAASCQPLISRSLAIAAKRYDGFPTAIHRPQLWS